MSIDRKAGCRNVVKGYDAPNVNNSTQRDSFLNTFYNLVVSITECGKTDHNCASVCQPYTNSSGVEMVDIFTNNGEACRKCFRTSFMCPRADFLADCTEYNEISLSNNLSFVSVSEQKTVLKNAFGYPLSDTSTAILIAVIVSISIVMIFAFFVAKSKYIRFGKHTALYGSRIK